jgi:hypothetical protein
MTRYGKIIFLAVTKCGEVYGISMPTNGCLTTGAMKEA